MSERERQKGRERGSEKETDRRTEKGRERERKRERSHKNVSSSTTVTTWTVTQQKSGLRRRRKTRLLQVSSLNFCVKLSMDSPPRRTLMPALKGSLSPRPTQIDICSIGFPERTICSNIPKATSTGPQLLRLLTVQK